MTDAHVTRRRWLTAVGFMCLLWVVSGQALRCETQTDAGANYVNTVREGLAYRAALIRTLTGRAEMQFAFSAATCERSQREAEEYAKRIKWVGEVLPLDSGHKSHMQFTADFDKGQWLCDVADVTVSGHRLWASSKDPALNRQLAPETFRRIAVSDGARICVDDHSLQRGWIETYTRQPWQVPQPLAHVEEMVRGVCSSVFSTLADPLYDVEYQGEEEVGGYGCLKIHARPKDPSLGGIVVTLWSAPALDFAVVREEYHSYLPATSPGGQPVRDVTWITLGSDFAKVSDLLWSPQTSEATYYRYRADEPGGDPLEYTRLIRITSMEANGPLQGIATPYEFPPGTEVTDRTSAPEGAGG